VEGVVGGVGRVVVSESVVIVEEVVVVLDKTDVKLT
jgi:hypothetical protein